MNSAIKADIESGRTSLGIELGSTRIKAVLIDSSFSPVASGEFVWENRLENGIWTYHLDDVWTGLQESFRRLSGDVKARYGVELKRIGSIGISGMMHGYLAFDENDNLLAPFKTWRNTDTEEAAEKLTSLFGVNVPLRWTVSHLYQAILNEEEHAEKISYVTTLAGYVHYKLTGEKILGVGEASGTFPIDDRTRDYDAVMLKKFNSLIKDKYNWRLQDILFEVKCAGSLAGTLTETGAALLDPSGVISSGIPFCPPEGDAGTGMVATNSVAERTGNVSAGTSIFAMMVLEKALSKMYTEIDMVTTPAGKPVAMVHCNNCTSDLDAWVKLFTEVLSITGSSVSKSDLYDFIYNKALEGEKDCGGLLSYNYCSGEPITGFIDGRPLFVRTADSRLNLANFARNLLYSSMATLKLGMDILRVQENYTLSVLLGHGGLFKTQGVAQELMSAALDVPVSVMESAGEGGAWGIALLAAYMSHSDEPLEVFLNEKVFCGREVQRIEPNEANRDGFEAYMKKYIAGLDVERSAVENV